jgi:hypothetical protein
MKLKNPQLQALFALLPADARRALENTHVEVIEAPRMTLAALHGFARSHMEDVFKDKLTLDPTWLIAGNGEGIIKLWSRWDNDKEKARIVRVTSRFMRVLGCMHYAFFDEVWMVQVSSEEEIKKGAKASQDPRRVERCMVTTCNTVEGFMSLYEIERAKWSVKLGKRLDCKPMGGDKKLKGTFATMLLDDEDGGVDAKE